MPIWGWALFLAGLVALLLVDLFGFQNDAHVVSAKEAGTVVGHLDRAWACRSPG